MSPLAVQNYLRGGKSIVDLYVEFAIAIGRHPTLPLRQFSYNQIDSPKSHPIVRECRGLILEEGSWNVVAKPFSRFFNLGEHKEDNEKFNWNDYVAYEKADGSLIILSFYAGEWRVNTRGSFGFGPVGRSAHVWHEMFWRVSGLTPEHLKGLEKHTLLFELCSLYNKNVRRYVKPVTYLIGATHELHDLNTAELAQLGLPVSMPDIHKFGSRQELERFILDKEQVDPTYEGLVLRDSSGIRMKFKSKTYTALHHLRDNGNVLLPKRLVPIVMTNEADEILVYMPEIKDALFDCRNTINTAISEIIELWEKNKTAPDQKSFALAVKHHKLSGMMFRMRKDFPNGGKDDIIRILREIPEILVKALFQDKIWEFTEE